MLLLLFCCLTMSSLKPEYIVPVNRLVEEIKLASFNQSHQTVATVLKQVEEYQPRAGPFNYNHWHDLVDLSAKVIEYSERRFKFMYDVHTMLPANSAAQAAIAHASLHDAYHNIGFPIYHKNNLVVVTEGNSEIIFHIPFIC
jgi:hypothetical protein